MTPDSSSRRRTVLLFLVPPLYLALIVALQPADRLGDSAITPWLGRAVYDDYDLTAGALRGLNAHLGRTAGRLEEPPAVEPHEFAYALDHPAEPEPRYFLEYPHAAVALFRLGFALQGGPDRDQVPVAVQDTRQDSLIGHMPRNDAEHALWRCFRRAIHFYQAVLTLCLVLFVVIVRRGYDAEGRLAGPIVLLLLPATLYFSLNRFDVLPALLTAASLFCLGRRWFLTSAVFLAAATMIKVYPLLLAPLWLRYGADDLRAAVRWCAAYAVTVAAMLLPPLLLSGVSATFAPYVYQLSRAPEFGWTVYGPLLPRALAEHGLWRHTLLLLLAGVCCWSRPRDLDGVLRRGALLVLLFVTLAVFWSPQWIIWFAPLLVPLARRSRAVFGLYVALDVLTYLSFPLVFDSDLANPSFLRVPLIWARCALAVTLAWVLVRDEWSHRAASGY